MGDSGESDESGDSTGVGGFSSAICAAMTEVKS